MIYADVLLTSLILICTVALLRIFIYPEKIYEFPYLVSATYVGFILPQAYILYDKNYTVPEGALDSLFFMCLLCLIMCFLGYTCINKNVTRSLIFKKTISISKLTGIGIIYTVVGLTFFLILLQMPSQRQATGLYTIIHFFSDITYLGFTICLLCFLKCNNHKLRYTLLIFLIIGATMPLYKTFYEGKREQTLLFLLIIGLSLYFERGFKVKRLLFTFIFVIGIVAIPAIDLYRTNVQDKSPLRTLLDINLLEVYNNYLEEGTSLELRNAAYIINLRIIDENYNWGAGYWNKLIFRYIPSQLIGEDFKNSLYLKKSIDDISHIEDSHGGILYTKPTGTTFTGIGDSFMEFSYFGCLFFFMQGIFFKKLWINSNFGYNKIFSQLLYIQIIIKGVMTVTHGTVNFLPSLFYNLILLCAAYMVARTSFKNVKVYA